MWLVVQYYSTRLGAAGPPLAANFGNYEVFGPF